jgi:heme iron utilization protein
MTHEDTLRTELQDLLGSQRLAVLSTHDRGQPYASLVAFAATGDLSRILFATARTTRKFHNLANDARVALLIDNRSNTERDFHQAMAATAIGVSREIPPGEDHGLRDLYLSKHPYLEGFLNSDSCALVEVSVAKYLVVNRFQNVFELKVGP